MDLYNILGLDRKASKKDIKKAYKKKAKENHPDINPDSEEFVKVNKAYSILSDSVKRIAYDKYGQEDDNMDKQVRGLILRLMEEMVKVKPDKPVAYFRRKTNEMQQNIKEGIRQKKREITIIRKFMDRVVKIDPFVTEHFNSRIEALNDVVKRYTYDRDVTKKAYQFFKHYIFKEDRKEDSNLAYMVASYGPATFRV